MILSFSEFMDVRKLEISTDIQEKLIVYGGGKKYGQIVFMAGGAGSGKGFAISNFVNSSDFKIRDVDELKLAFQKLDDLRIFSTEELLLKYKDKLTEKDIKHIEDHVLSKGYSLRDLNLKTPEHVYALHVLVAATGVKNKTLDLMLQNAKPGTLPNIIFDTTFKDMDEMNALVPRLLEVGYEAKDIHITWVLTNYEIAIKNNAKRSRVVPADIMLKTHVGAATTVMQLAHQGVPSTVDGGFYVILNNPKNTLFAIDPDEYRNKFKLFLAKKGIASFNDLSTKEKKKIFSEFEAKHKKAKAYESIKGKKVVSNFLYLTLKKPGKAMTNDTDIKKQLYDWVTKNVPKQALDKISMDKL